jgi:hypothetical protein
MRLRAACGSSRQRLVHSSSISAASESWATPVTTAKPLDFSAFLSDERLDRE